ncbi:MAG: hypothetical protein L3J16_00725 [Anaerolineales bacterium]|nr:hypothetical protein [Anaerolineales bacterium]
MRNIIYSLLTLSFVLGACSPQASKQPELNTEDVQATAVSMAWTMAAQTIEARPTETSVPPTETSVPTYTPIPATATPAVTFTPIPTATQEKDVCDQPLMSWGGQSVPIVVENRTSEKISYISIYVAPNARGECGYVPANGSSFSVPYGCFYAFASMQGKKNYSTSGGPFCVNNPDTWHLIIKQSQITLKSP